MSNIDFYFMPESPPSRAVEMAATALGIKLNKCYVNLFTRDNRKEEYIKINPAGKVPFIVDGDLKLGESRAIMAYLVNKYVPGDNPIYPKAAELRARVDEMLFKDMGFYAAAGKLLHPKLYGPVKELNAEAEEALCGLLELIEKHLEQSNKKFYIGDNYTLGDISMAATMSFVISCGYDLSKYKALNAYLDRLKEAIPEYSEINDKANENLANYVKSKQEGQ